MLENIRLSFQGVWSHRLRSFLTMLGIIIGIAAIIAIVSTIKGTNEQIKKNLIGSGTNTTTVQLTEEGNYPAELLQPATLESYCTEFLDYKMAIKTVNDVVEAVTHIYTYGSGHSECIVTEDKEAAAFFTRAVDAACVYVNAPTSFTDGAQFGLGAEIGISTQKLHARGPMGLREMTTYKWIVEGDGQVRKK